VSSAEIDEIEKGLAAGSLRPDLAKRHMAREIVVLYHGSGASAEAEALFDQAHRERDVPEEASEVRIPNTAIRDGKVWMPRLLVELNLASSNSEGRRLIEYGAVRIDGRLITEAEKDMDASELNGRVLQVGRRLLGRGMKLVL